jgi:hypothetical protein
MEVVTPALPKRIRIRMMRLRRGWVTIVSDSWVVNPTPENADWDWKDAISGESPVSSKAITPILTTTIDKRRIINKLKSAIIGLSGLLFALPSG